jgi:hypothetical protein
MEYTLYHKTIPVLNFEINDYKISKINDILNKRHIPTGITQDSSESLNLQKFNKWWTNRAIPLSRQNLKNALNLLGNITIEQLITKSYGLSLSDHYWAKPSMADLKWEDINFFQNPFSEDVGNALFETLKKDSSDADIISPDNTSDGWLKKKWIIQNDKRILIKGGSGESQQEPFNEVLASEICKRLGINHVEYKIINQDYDYYSSCPNFVSINSEFVPASAINSLRDFKGDVWDKYNHFKDNCKLAGIDFSENLEKQLCSIFILDFIIANEDRHFGNFGFLRNPDSLEWLGLAPVFDSGSSLFYKFPSSFLKDNDKTKSENIIARPFGYHHSDQIKLLPCLKLCKDLPFHTLTDIPDFFNSLLKQNTRIDETRRTLLCGLLKNRIEELKKYENI